MKKQFLLIVSILLAQFSYAQYSVTGTVTTTSSTAVAGQQVYIMIDSLLNPPTTPYWSAIDTTDGSGAYAFTLPSSTASGTILRITTANCTGPHLSNTPTYTGINLTSNFVKCASSSSAIYGQVTLGTTFNPAVNAKVFFIDIDTSTSTPVLTLKDSTVTNSFGSYTATFPPLSGSHRILVKAFLQPSSPSYSNYLPTYAASSLMWSGASAYLPPISSGGVNIQLIAGTNPGGPGFIGGSVLMGANKTTGVGDPLPGRLILLTNSNGDAVAYTYSDAAGLFSFPSLPYGTYKISGDVFGKTSTPLSITLDASNKKVDYVLFEEKSKTFNASLNATGIAMLNGNAVSIYPNPVKNELTITGIPTGSTIRLLDIYGKVVASPTVKQSAQVINTSSLAAGTYLLQITDATGNKAVQKIIKE